MRKWGRLCNKTKSLSIKNGSTMIQYRLRPGGCWWSLLKKMEFQSEKRTRLWTLSTLRVKRSFNYSRKQDVLIGWKSNVHSPQSTNSTLEKSCTRLSQIRRIKKEISQKTTMMNTEIQKLKTTMDHPRTAKVPQMLIISKAYTMSSLQTNRDSSPYRILI